MKYFVPSVEQMKEYQQAWPMVETCADMMTYAKCFFSMF
jgi:hypothetical protein